MGEGCVGGLCASRADTCKERVAGTCAQNLPISTPFKFKFKSIAKVFSRRDFYMRLMALGEVRCKASRLGSLGCSAHLSALSHATFFIRKASSAKQPLCMHTAAPLVLNSILPYTRSLLPRFLFSLPTFPHCSLAATACFYSATFYLFAISFGYCT